MAWAAVATLVAWWGGGRESEETEKSLWLCRQALLGVGTQLTSVLTAEETGSCASVFCDQNRVCA